MQNLDELNEKIANLERRIIFLEKKEKRRVIINYIKLIIAFIMLISLIFSIFYLYNYFTDYLPNAMEESLPKDLLDYFKRS